MCGFDARRSEPTITSFAPSVTSTAPEQRLRAGITSAGVRYQSKPISRSDLRTTARSHQRIP